MSFCIFTSFSFCISFLIIFYYYFIIVSQFFPRVPPPPTHHLIFTVNPHAVVHVCELFIHVRCLIPSPSFRDCSPPLPPGSLAVCSMFPCLWLYFVCQFILFIRFHLQVRTYGIFLSPTGLFHLAEYSPAPTMLSQNVRVSSFFLLFSNIHFFFDPLIS